MQRRIPLIATLLFASSVTAQGALVPRTIADIPSNEAATTAGQGFRATRVAGPDLSRSVKRVIKDLDWHKRLASAQHAARKSGKPILWIQLLGDLDGYA